MYEFSKRSRLFLQMKTKKDLLDVLNISEKKLNYLLYTSNDLYTSFLIKKKNGSMRQIVSPVPELKKVQRDLHAFLQQNYLFDESTVQGFIKGHSIKTNASLHQSANFILNIDLQNFFPTIHFGRVRGMFMHEPFSFPNEIATILAKLVCYQKSLPQGAPTSPVIANIICYKLDRELNHFCKRYNCTYTRYADDLTISSSSVYFPSEMAVVDENKITLGKRIEQMITSEGFRINPHKIHFSSLNTRQEVTGLIVNKKVNVKKIYLKNLRAALHKISKYGFYLEGAKYFSEKHSKYLSKQVIIKKYQQMIQGRIEFLKMIRGIHDLVYIKYASLYNYLVQKEVFDVDYGKEIPIFMENRTFPIFSYDRTCQGTAFLTHEFGLITSTHVLFNKDTFLKKANYLAATKSETVDFSSLDAKPFFLLDHLENLYPLHITMNQKDILSDLYFDQKIHAKKEFRVNPNYIPKIGEMVYLAGYGDFKNYKETSLNFITAKITGTDSFDKRKIYCISEKIYHGMSGGPVINQNREVIGIIYVGLNLESAEYGVMSKHNGFILFHDIFNT